MLEVGSDLWRFSLLTHPHLEQVSQDYVQMPFGYLQAQRLFNLSAPSLPVLNHLGSKKKKKSFTFRKNKND